MIFHSTIKYLKDLFIPTSDNKYRPSFLQTRWFYFALAFLFALKIISTLLLHGYYRASVFSEVSRQDVYSLVNQERSNHGLSVLKINPKLEIAAELKLADIRANSYFSHTSPAGRTPWTWINQARYDYELAGENLAMNFFSGHDTVKAWMSSEGHRRNILLNKFEDTGVASGKATIDGLETVVIVQMFGKERKSNPVVAKVITPVKASEPTPTPTKKAEIKSIIKSSVGMEQQASAAQSPSASPVKQNPIVPLKIEEVPQSTDLLAGEVKDETLYATDRTLRAIMKWIFFGSLIVLALNILVSIKVQIPRLIVKGVILIIVAYALGIGNWIEIVQKGDIKIGQEAALTEVR